MPLRRRDLLVLPAAVLHAAPISIPAKSVTLTFDDAVKSHRTFVAPLLKELGFQATFFVSHKWMPDTKNFMSWQDVAEIHQMGFEIGNHSWTHSDFSTPRAASHLAGELALVNYELNKVKVPKPTSFAWCGNTFGPESAEELRKSGITMARRGGAPEVEYGKLVVGPAFRPAAHHPLLIPTTGDGYPDWTFEHFLKVIAEAKEGQMVVLQFHGVPDVAHPWVHTPPDNFKRYMEHLKKEGYQTFALRDLSKFAEPHSDDKIFRYPAPKSGKPLVPEEGEATQKDLTYWRKNMGMHRYTKEEASATVFQSEPAPTPVKVEGLQIAPYPGGGRHARIGNLDAAIDPMRGTKASVFLPWEGEGYVVVDVPEAIFAGRELIFLAHTHIPTIWDDQNIRIQNVDWQRMPDGSLRLDWRLPNEVRFGTSMRVQDQAIHMDLWITNGSKQPLAGLRSQVCVMFRGAPSFSAQTNANKRYQQPRAAVESSKGKRWILTEWEGCQRVWGNTGCPCMHSDPAFADCAPGETVRRSGRIWFHEGEFPA